MKKIPFCFIFNLQSIFLVAIIFSLQASPDRDDITSFLAHYRPRMGNKKPPEK
jgi:hypothetical protein